MIIAIEEPALVNYTSYIERADLLLSLRAR
jgi:hypothetical protein